MSEIKRETLEAIIANVVDNIVGAVRPGNVQDIRKVAYDLNISNRQAEAAIIVTHEVSGRKGWGA